MNEYIIYATTQDCTALDFFGLQFNTIKDAIDAFDEIYNRKGFKIEIYKLDGINDPILARTVKKTYA